MPINGATLLEGATCAATGGTSKTYAANGAVVKNGVQIIDTSVTDARVRPSVSVSSRMATLQTNGKWSYERREILCVRPKILADGSIGFNSVRVLVNFHPESSAAEIDELYDMGAQPLFDADFATFRTIGTLA